MPGVSMQFQICVEGRPVTPETRVRPSVRDSKRIRPGWCTVNRIVKHHPDCTYLLQQELVSLVQSQNRYLATLFMTRPVCRWIRSFA